MVEAVVDFIGNDKLSQFIKATRDHIAGLKTEITNLRTSAQSSMSGVTTEFNKVKTGVGSVRTEITTFKNSLDTVKTSGAGAAQGMKQVSDASNTMKQRLVNVGSAFTGLVANIGTFSMSIVNLMRQYRDLEDTQIAVDRTAKKLQASQLALSDAEDKAAEIKKKNGKNSEEYARALEKVDIAEQNVAINTDLHNEALEAQGDAYQNFYLSIIPNVVSAVGILVGTFTSLRAASLGASNGIGGVGGGLGGLVTKLGPIGLILGAITAAIIAIKTNAFGFRDFINDIGVRLGNALPFLKPFLDFLTNVGVILGIIPGDADAARTSLGLMFESIKTWFTEGFATIQKFFDLLTKLDFAGAFNLIKEAIDKALPGLTDAIEEFFKDPVGITIDTTVTVGKWILDQKGAGGITLEKELLGLGVFFTLEAKKKGGIKAGIEVFSKLVDWTIESLLPEDWAKAYKSFTTEYDKTKGANLAKWLIDINTKVNSWVLTNVDEPLRKAIADTFTLDNLNKAFNAIASTLQTAGSNALNYIFQGMTNFSVTQLDPFISSLFKIETWQQAFEAKKAEMLKVGAAIFNAIFGNTGEVDKAGKQISGFATALGTALKNIDWEATGTAIIDGISNWFKTNLPQTTDTFLGMANAIGDGLINAANNAPQQILQAGQALFAELIEGMKSIPAVVDSFVKWLFDQMLQKIPGLKQALEFLGKITGTSTDNKPKVNNAAFYDTSNLVYDDSTGTFTPLQDVPGGGGAGGPNKRTQEAQMLKLSAGGQKPSPFPNNDILARQINQLTINIKALTAANNLYARTLVQINTNTKVLTASNNLIARTINQLTINTRTLIASNNLIARTWAQINTNVKTLTNSHNTLARTQVQVDKNTKAIITSNNTLARTFVQLEKNVRAYTKALNSIPKKITTTLEIKTKKVSAATGFAGWVPHRTQFEVAENEPEFVLAIPQSRFSTSDMNVKINEAMKEKSDKIRNKVIDRLEKKGIDPERIERWLRWLVARPIQVTVMTPDHSILGKAVNLPLMDAFGFQSG